jgi:ubiquinone/menaquinone biosynthesis C-methylase UbiE
MQRGYRKDKRSTSWEGVSKWYNKVTEYGRGHYYHQHVVIPGVLKLLNLSPQSKVLDLACGNGVLAKSLSNGVECLGVDLSDNLVQVAKNEDKNPKHGYLTADVSRPLTIPVDFTHTAVILALQNIATPSGVIGNAARHMASGGKLVIVLNHPMFRIPRQSSWGTEEKRKIQYRRVDRYLSPMTIPIKANPSNPQSQTTLSYHLPLSAYSKMLNASGFTIELIEEWASDKESEGRAAKMENRSRDEFPLFMAIVAVKK